MVHVIASWLLIPLVLTEVIELVLARVALGVRSRDDLVTVALAQVVTNPAVQLIALLAGCSPHSPVPGWPWVVVLLAEVVTFVVEALLYRFAGLKRPWAASAVLNAASFAIGLGLALAGAL